MLKTGAEEAKAESVDVARRLTSATSTNARLASEAKAFHARRATLERENGALAAAVQDLKRENAGLKNGLGRAEDTNERLRERLAECSAATLTLLLRAAAEAPTSAVSGLSPSPSASSGATCVIVKNLAAGVGAEHLRATFSVCGAVLDARVAGSGGQFAFVEFATRAEATKALRLSGMALGLSLIHI